MALSKIDGTNFIEGTVPSTVAPGAGKVLQVKSFTLDTAFSMVGTTFVDTGISVDITPSSTSSKILIWGHIGTSCDSSAIVPSFRLLRDDTTSIGQNTSSDGQSAHASFYGGDTGLGTENVFANIGFGFLDSPSTTSSTNFAIYMRGLGSVTNYINRTPANRANTGSKTVSTITAMEISG